MHELFGEPISIYTREDAIADGMIYPIDADERWPGPVVLTIGIHSDFLGAELEALLVRMLDCVLTQLAADPDEYLFTLDVDGRQVWCELSGDGVTVMYPEER